MPKNKEMVLLITAIKNKDGTFSIKVEGQGDQERRAREELFILPSLETNEKDALNKFSQKVMSEAVINFVRVFKTKKM